MAAKAVLCLAWSETPEDTFCRVLAQIYYQIKSENIKGADVYLACYEQIFSSNRALYNQLFDSTADRPLVPVDGSTIQVAVTILHSSVDGINNIIIRLKNSYFTVQI